MGAFYGSILVRTENSDEVQKALNEVARALDCKFLVGPPIDGWISIFPDHSGQSDKPAIETAKLLPYDIFHLIVHDDDIFIYGFFRGGRLVDEYNSCPDYFKKVSAEEKQKCQGRPELFQDLLGKPETLKKVKTLLAADKDEYTFEQERMGKFVEFLGLPNAVGSYEFLDAGERDGIEGWKQFIHIPDLSDEKAAKRAAQAKIKAEKKRLQKEGLFLAEIKPKEKHEVWPDLIAWAMNNLRSNGFIVTPSETKQPQIKIKGLDGAGITVHPSGKFGVGKVDGALGIIDIEKQHLIKKLAINRKMETLNPFAKVSKGTMAHAWIKSILQKSQMREKLGVDALSYSAIIQNPDALEKLSPDTQQKIKSILEQVVQRSMIRPRETQEQIFDLLFNPNGQQLFVASKGMRVFDWNKLLSAEKDAPSPEFAVDAPVHDETDPNARPMVYDVRFDPERNLLLSGCLAGIIQYLNVKTGQSGTLLKLLDEVSVWQLELTDGNNALCCFCNTRLKPNNIHKEGDYFLQVWNYPALCKAAGLS